MRFRLPTSLPPFLVFLLAAAVLRAIEAPIRDPNTPKPGSIDAFLQETESFLHETEKPFSWLQWGADLRLREEYYNNAATLNGSVPNHEYNYRRYRSRVYESIHPLDNVSLSARATWEWREYTKPDSRSNDINLDEVIIDSLNLKWGEAGGLPLTFTVGRQDMRLGSGWLFMEGTPLDGSRTFFFDGARATWAQKDWSTLFDAVYLQQSAYGTDVISPFNDQHRALIEQDERGAILYASNRSFKDTEIDGWFAYKHARRVLQNGDNADIYVPGLRVARNFSEAWRAETELAPEFGDKNGRTLEAFGAVSSVSCRFRDPMQNVARLTYEYLSGDQTGSKGTNEAFDPLWGRWPMWTDLLGFTYARETRAQEITNLHRVGPGWSFVPCKHAEIQANYFLLFADENTRGGQPGFSADGRCRGQFVSAFLKFFFTDHLTGQFQAEFFMPGNYYSSAMSDAATFFRYEMALKW